MKRMLALLVALCVVATLVPTFESQASVDCNGSLVLQGHVQNSNGRGASGVRVSLAIGYWRGIGTYQWYTFATTTDSQGDYSLSLPQFPSSPDIATASVAFGGGTSTVPTSCTIVFDDLTLGCKGCPDIEMP